MSNQITKRTYYFVGNKEFETCKEAMIYVAVNGYIEALTKDDTCNLNEKEIIHAANIMTQFPWTTKTFINNIIEACKCKQE